MGSRRVAVYGAGEPALALLPGLARCSDLELAAVFDPDARVLRRRLALIEPAAAVLLEQLLTDDPDSIDAAPDLALLIDTGLVPEAAQRFPGLAARQVEVISLAEAQRRFAGGAETGAAQADDALVREALLQALAEIDEAAALVAEPAALHARLLTVALDATGAEGGALLLGAPAAEGLAIAACEGLEGATRARLRFESCRAAMAEGRPQLLHGVPDPYAPLRTSAPIAAVLCAPLSHGGDTLGVLCLHHATRADAFESCDLGFAAALASAMASLVRRAGDGEALRQRAEGAERLLDAALGWLDRRDPAAIAREAAAAAARMFGARHAVLRLRDAPDGRYAVRALAGPAAGATREALLRLDRIAAREALRRGAALRDVDLVDPGAAGCSLLAVPLPKRAGTLAVYERGGPPFAIEDGPRLERIARLAAHALAASAVEARRAGGADATPSGDVARHLDAALANAAARPFALLGCWIEPRPGMPAGREALLLRLARGALRAVLREGEWLGAAPWPHAWLAVLGADAGAPADRVARLARAAAERLADAPAPDAAERPALVFGYAVHPTDGRTRDALLARVAVRRIGML